MVSKLLLINVPAKNPRELSAFYSKMMGIEFGRSFSDQAVSYHAPISSDGALMNIQERYQSDEPVACYFAVEDLDKTIGEVRAAGGDIVDLPRDLPISERMAEDYRNLYREAFGTGDTATTLGRAAMMADPEGNHFGLMELQQHARAIFRMDDQNTRMDDGRVAVHLKTVEAGKKLEG